MSDQPTNITQFPGRKQPEAADIVRAIALLFDINMKEAKAWVIAAGKELSEPSPDSRSGT